MARVLGVLGGMGPAATLGFLERVQALTPAQGDADHIRVLMDLNPHVPDRNRTPELAGVELGRMAERLKLAGADILAMPCNTAHAMTDEVRAVGLPFIDMIAETTRVAVATGATRIGVLATPGGEALYIAAFKAAGLQAVLLEGEDRASIMALIYGVKAGQTGPETRAEMARLADVLIHAGAGAVIAGCTEVPLLLAADEVSVPLVDSTEVLARVCIEQCI